MAQALLLTRNQTEGPNASPLLLRKTVPFVRSVTSRMQFPSGFGDRAPPKVSGEGEELCPTLTECLMYQACAFNYGNEFCRRDPFPGARKNLNINVTCVKVSACILLILIGVSLFDVSHFRTPIWNTSYNLKNTPKPPWTNTYVGETWFSITIHKIRS